MERVLSQTNALLRLYPHNKAWLYLALGLACMGCGPALPDDLSAFYETMQDNALHFPRHDGAWEHQSGDASYYGPAFYIRAETPPGDRVPPYPTIARAARDYNRDVLRHAQQDRSWLLKNLEEVMMSALGLIEYIAATADPTAMPEVEDTIDTLDTLTVGLHHYINLDAGMFAIRTYGPTAITAAVGLLNLQYMTQLGSLADPERAAQRVETARDIVAAIDERAWDGQRYLIRPGDARLELYPNTMMMLVLCRLYQTTKDAAYLARAEAVFTAIAPLRSERGGYNSPYSKEEMGAKTDDYSTLSSQNYLTLALGLLFETTGNRRYFDEAVFVLEFVRTHLYDAETGLLLHHFMDGRIARPTDPEYFCIGCNLQFLYVFWFLHHSLSAMA